jgi:solute carrier family 12 sodium/potassium/chloride transporter 2
MIDKAAATTIRLPWRRRPGPREAAASPGQAADGVARFGSFGGVFRPVFLTVMGALIYLREGWLVGNCGLLGALAVILAALLITGTTALSVSSIATNVPVRPGGAFAIIARALGLEAGGAIGIPLYIAQSASAAMYLYAFTEAWAILFPSHQAGVVVAVAFLGIVALAWSSAALAFKAQAAMFVLVILALSSAALGLFTADLQAMPWRGAYPEASLREAFSIFFPAATGIMVGVGMSGELRDPRRSIPRGSLLAWGVTGALYLAAAFWYGAVATQQELLDNNLIMLDRALVGPLVLIGLLCSTLMAALSSVIAAPRLLQAMAADQVVPAARWLARSSEAGQPRVASGVTLGLTGLFLLSGSLDAIAPIVTAFFLVTYLAVNLVVLVEQVLGMISFRPTFRVWSLVPAAGVVACTTGLMLSSPGKGLMALVLVGGIYAWIQRRHLDAPWETVRSGLTVNVAAWAARRAAHFERSQRAWKPDLLVPVETSGELRSLLPVAQRLAGKQGSVKLVGLQRDAMLGEALAEATATLTAAGIHASSTATDSSGWIHGAGSAVDVLQGALFPPNLVLVDADLRSGAELGAMLEHCRGRKLGLGLYQHHPRPGGVQHNEVTVWLSDRSPGWSLRLHMANLDLPVLLAILLTRKGGRIRLATVVRDPSSMGDAEHWLRRLVDMGRLPASTRTTVLQGDFIEALGHASVRSDLHLLGLGETVDKAQLEAFRQASGAACLFLVDSGQESLLA